MIRPEAQKIAEALKRAAEAAPIILPPEPEVPAEQGQEQAES